MSFLIATPDAMAAAASDLANIGSAIGSANSAAAVATSGVLPAAADEVSAEIAALFSAHAVGYQQLSAHAAAFHQQFVEAMNLGAATYASAETSVVQTMASAVPALGLDLGGALGGLEASLAADISGLSGALNAGLSLNLAGGLSGMAPLGAALTADLNGGLSALAQTGASLTSSLNTGLSGLANLGVGLPALSGALTAGLPGLQATLTGGLAGLNAELNAALSGGLGGSLSGLGPVGAMLAADVNGALSTLAQTGAALPALSGVLAAGLPGLAASLSATFPALSADIAGLAGMLGLNAGLFADVTAGLAGMGAQLSAFLTGGLSASLAGIPALLGTLTAPWQALLTAASPGAFLAQLQAMEIAFNTSLVNAELGFNAALVANEAGLELALFGNLGNGVLNSFYNFWNPLLGAGEATFDAILGAPVGLVGTALIPSLFVGTSPSIFGAALGGLLAAVPDKFLWDLNIISAITGALTGNGALSATLTGALSGAGLSVSALLNGSLFAGIPTTGAALIAAPLAGLQGIGSAELGFFNNLVGMETAFDTNLLASELTWEASTFGAGAFNGALDRLFNVANLTVLTGQQAVNGVLGGAALPASGAFGPYFLTGSATPLVPQEVQLIAPSLASSTPVFDGAGPYAIGGIEGIFDQTLAAGVDLAGML